MSAHSRPSNVRGRGSKNTSVVVVDHKRRRIRWALGFSALLIVCLIIILITALI
ncbi:hypothetical protein [Gordonia humi]|uniref:Uncharacterized protein n=1 Tax=Gordonia humi TaxID=686429 RepID=A0A840F6A1_9ACTN|nr:hypothetical protein [Gordonia humi]MBB4138083.1 hypothetical protein [Gordonia humi]